MKDIKHARIVKGLNKWLKDHNFNIDVNWYVEGEGYIIKLYSASTARLISTTVCNVEHIDSQYKEFIRNIIFNTIIKPDFEASIT